MQTEMMMRLNESSFGDDASTLARGEARAHPTKS
jgi:hypothetical protein